MIRPPGFTGAAYGTAAEGDLRKDPDQRGRVAATLGITSEWAYANQVHGATVLVADRPGSLGDGDAVISRDPGIPVMVATADCVPIVLEAPGAVAVVHAGWRGAAAGVLVAAIATMEEAGHRPARAGIGPAIGPCCYEVGREVVAQFPGFVARTSWGTPSVDIPSFLEAQLAETLANVEVWRSDECTYTSKQFNSWRRDRTKNRQVTVGWLPDS